METFYSIIGFLIELVGYFFTGIAAIIVGVMLSIMLKIMRRDDKIKCITIYPWKIEYFFKGDKK